MVQHDIQLTHEIKESDALKLLQGKLNCDRVDDVGHYVVQDYIISAYQFFKMEGIRTRLAYQVASRSTIKSDAGPKPPHLSSFYGIVPMEGFEIPEQKLAEIREGLEALVVS